MPLMDMGDGQSQSVEAILNFWFGASADDSQYEQRRKLWFRKRPEMDQHIRDRFQKVYEQAAAEKLEEWKHSPQGCLALILLLDQFPRNMFRDTPQAFTTDSKALALSKWAIAQGFDQRLEPMQRIFIYLPLEHSEDLVDQNQCVWHFQQLTESNPWLKDMLDYALRHQAVIERFGRFPHRNRILGRETTPEEATFLQQPGSSF